MAEILETLTALGQTRQVEDRFSLELRLDQALNCAVQGEIARTGADIYRLRISNFPLLASNTYLTANK